MEFWSPSIRLSLLLSGLLLSATLLGCLSGKDDPSGPVGPSNRGHFTVLDPGTGGSVPLDTNLFTVRWSNGAANPPTSVRIDLYQGESLLVNLGPDVPNGGSFAWNVGSTRMASAYRFGSGTYRLKITSAVDTSAWDFSGGFYVTSPWSGSIAVTAPTANASLAMGQTASINWQASLGRAGSDTGGGMGSMAYVLRLFKGSNPVSTISIGWPGVARGAAAYPSWSVAPLQGSGNDYRIQVLSAANPSLNGFSGTFSIRSQFFHGSIAVLSPGTGDTVRSGSASTYSIDTAGYPGYTATILLYRDNAPVRNLTTSAVLGQVIGTWLVPDLPDTSNRYRLQVVSNQDPGISGYSGYFTILGNGASNPGAPRLLSPANGATGLSTMPLLTWTSVPGNVSYYTVVVSRSSVFLDTASYSHRSDTSRYTDPLVAGTTYYWHARAVGPSGDGAWSSTWSFTTAGSSGSTPDAYEQDNSASQAKPITVNAASQSRNLHVFGDRDWISFSAMAGMDYVLETGGLTDTYVRLYATDGATLLMSDDESGVGSNGRIDWSCLTSGRYYLVVSGYLDGETGDYSVSVQSRLPGAPEVSEAYPLDGAIDVPLSGDYAFVGVAFNTSMDSAATLAAFSVVPTPMGGQKFFFRDSIYGDVVLWADTNFQETIFAPSTPYTATVSATARSRAGVNLAAAYRITFTTGPLITIPRPTEVQPPLRAVSSRDPHTGLGVRGGPIRGVLRGHLKPD